MSVVQPSTLASVSQLSRHLVFSLTSSSAPRQVLQPFNEIVDGEEIVVGFSQSLVHALEANIEGLRTFPHHVGAGIDVPSTPAALWRWLRGDDRGHLVHKTRLIQRTLTPAFLLHKVIDAFQYGPSLDLTGYEDGTENPKGEEAAEVAVLKSQEQGLDGFSFVAVQQWIHDLDHFESMTTEERGNTIGRRKSDNEEIDDAPDSAHVKRTEQESFTPEAFILRRSMPWADETKEGLVFVAFGKSVDAFEALLKRMAGIDDGITDALFKFTRPVSGSYFWCPPVSNGHLDLWVLGM